jgi:hypothetical protein
MDDRAAEREPETLAEKIEWLIANAFPEGEEPWGDQPSDRAVTAAINGHCGRAAVSHPTFGKMRSGAIDPNTGEPYFPKEDAIIKAVASFFDVDPLFFKPQHEVVRHVVESLNFLRAVHRGDVQGLAGRGVTDGLPPELLAYISEVADDFGGDKNPPT